MSITRESLEYLFVDDIPHVIGGFLEHSCDSTTDIRLVSVSNNGGSSQIGRNRHGSAGPPIRTRSAQSIPRDQRARGARLQHDIRERVSKVQLQQSKRRCSRGCAGSISSLSLHRKLNMGSRYKMSCCLCCYYPTVWNRQPKSKRCTSR